MRTAICAMLLALFGVGAALAQVTGPPGDDQPVASSSPPSRPRVDIGVGFADVRVRELPPRDTLGQGALSLYASVGYMWTPHVITQIDIASAVETLGWDFEHVRLVTPSRTSTLTLSHRYDVSRWSVAQLVQFGRRVQPYAGGGIAVETQTTGQSYQNSLVILGPDARTITDYPDAASETVHHTVLFAEAGILAFVTRRVAFFFDWRSSAGDRNGSGVAGLKVRVP